MKVDKISFKNINNSSKVKTSEETASSSFSQLFDQKNENKRKDELLKMMDDIKEHSEKLIDSKNVEILVTYKKMIKNFISQAVDFAFEIQDKRGMSRIGRNKILKTIAMIDESLVEITQNFLSDERNKIEMLSKIGELQGLMMNLFV